MWITDTLLGNLFAVIVTLSVALIGYIKWTYQYWERRNIPFLEPQFPYGSFGSSFGKRQHIGVELKPIYETMKTKGWKHGGMYGLLQPIYLVIDLVYVKNIMTKDFQYFSDRGIYHNEKTDPLTGHLFNISGLKWRNLRTKFTPTFTSGKMKQMFQTLVDCEASLQKKIRSECDKKRSVDIKAVLGCFTTDIIGSCAFGLDCNTFDDEDSPFRVFGRKTFERSFVRNVKRKFANTFPTLAKFFKMTMLPKDVSSFFLKMVKDTVNYREKNNVVRKDFMQLLIDLKSNKLVDEEVEENKSDGTTLTMEEIAAQSFVFFIAGFETSSTTMTFALYELAKHQNIQNKVRKEINSVLEKHGGKLTYDAVQEMKYLSQVIDETLRMYPPGPLLPRKCVQDYRVPNTDVVIEKNTIVLIPVYAIQHDEEYYPDPKKFDPERFSEQNKKSRHSYAYLPFGEGPRNCIGMRFGLMESKVGVTSLLKNFRFTVSEKTKEPVRMKPDTLVLTVEGDVWLDAHKI